VSSEGAVILCYTFIVSLVFPHFSPVGILVRGLYGLEYVLDGPGSIRESTCNVPVVHPHRPWARRRP